MQKRYNHKQIEPKWQKHWEEKGTFTCEADPSRPKYYVLDMFPYPSGAGLHVGHVEGYTATDIVARFKRKKGFNVLHPMGWDSFGLPAEQYAVRTGTHPRITTEENVDNFRKQLKSLGFSYDWNREVMTSDPNYYKWTQWIFTKLYEKGLAYEAELLVNFCPELGTVLANEEIENGLSKVGGFPVERRPLKQWVLKITEYADRLIQDLDLVDWPESLKRLQVNWIGRSEGAQIDFVVEGTEEKISAFTTCPETLFGSTFIVLSPEHPLVPKVTTSAQKRVVEDYQTKAARKSDLERTDLSRDKSGVFTGAYAINPATQKKMPIWIADYVLIGYGTGAIMAVPAHDERDFEFAEAYDLPISAIYDPDIERDPELVPIEFSPLEAKQLIIEGKLCWRGSGKCINSENSDLSLNGLTTEEAKKKIIDWIEKNGHGRAKVAYKLRDWLFSRQRYWGEPFPILHFEDGTKRVLDLEELPLSPPEVSDYKPTPDGLSPLAKEEGWVHLTDAKTGKTARRETNTMPQWAGSCWYYLRFVDPQNDHEAFAKEKEKYWLPVDLYVGGVEHAVLHLLYARFWHKVLYDCGIVSTPEPFKTLRNQGLIVSRSYKKESGEYVEASDVVQSSTDYTHRETGEPLTSQVEKMSKSKLNGVTPDEIIEEFGADSLRLYEMFMGPLEKEKIWNTDAVSGCRRFLSRFFDMVTSDKVTDEPCEEANKLGHRLLHGVNKDIEALQFNTAIAKMMEFMNDINKLEKYPRETILKAIHALSPFAPHIAEEAWQILQGEGELSHSPYPEVDESLLEDPTTVYVVQVNGKLRGRFELPKDQPKDVILDCALQNPSIAKHVTNTEIEKVIFIPNKILNLVTKKVDA